MMDDGGKRRLNVYTHSRIALKCLHNDPLSLDCVQNASSRIIFKSPGCLNCRYKRTGRGLLQSIILTIRSTSVKHKLRDVEKC